MVSFKSTNPRFTENTTNISFQNLKSPQKSEQNGTMTNTPKLFACEIDSSEQNFVHISNFVKEKGGNCPIQRVLLANNGIAAVKEIRSVRKWAYETFANDRIIEFVAMATPDDFKANAEYIKMADRVVEVPGGTNNNNFANVDLIVKLAQENHVQAVWAGWGHASENPKLPEKLSRCEPPIAFIGPRAASMRALGDKISSTIVAQSLDIPVIPWSGSGIIMDPTDCFDSEKCEPIYQSAGISSFEEAIQKAEIIGFPLMIKASEGGGGKGIRKIMSISEIKLAYEQVLKEVPGSPIFLMKLSQKSRHLEIQVVADQYGQALTLFGRDCSVQRRHQKIIEEAPISVISEEVAWKMERDAVKLAQSVRYESVGTVEYLYDIDAGKYYFLELNPRLQVEHPTTEMVSDVNIPATQMQIAMGIPLYMIGQIRSLWNQPIDGKNNFELINETRSRPKGHVIAARITAENPDAGFKPNSGKLSELNFKSFPETWGYFSIAPSGGLHEYADSQFGHIFAHGADRESARRNMVMALKELNIRGEFRTTVEYLIELLEKPGFMTNQFDTAWLDGLIAAQSGPSKRLAHEVAVLGGCTALAMCKFEQNEEEVIKSLQNRGIPNPTLLATELNLQFIQDGVSYSCTAIKSSPHQLTLNFQPSDESIVICAKKMPDNGFLININGKSHSAYVKAEGDNYRVTIDGKTCLLESEQDPTTVKSPSPGKLVRYLVEDGNHVTAGTPVAEIEVMKMYIPLQCGESGRITFLKPAGSSIETGDLIATLILDNPEASKNVNCIKDYEGGSFSNVLDFKEKPPIVELDANIQYILHGYVINDYKSIINNFYQRFNDSQEIIEYLWNQVCTLSGRINANLEHELKDLLVKGRSCAGPELEEVFTAIIQKIHFNGQASILQNSINIFFPSGKPDSLITFRRSIIIRVIDNYCKIERAFHGDVTAESLYSNLTKYYEADSDLAKCFRSHYNLQYKNQVLFYFLDRLLQSPEWGHVLVKDSDVESSLRKLTIFSGPKYFPVVHVSRDILLQSKNISPIYLYQQMESKLLQALSRGEESGLLEDMILGRYASVDVLPKFFNHESDNIRNWALEAYVRRTFQSFSPSSLEFLPEQNLPSGISSALTWNYCTLSHENNNYPEDLECNSDVEGGIDYSRMRAGIIAVLDGVFDPEACKLLLKLIDGENDKRRKVIYFIVPESLSKKYENEELFVDKKAEKVSSIRSLLHINKVRRITFAVNRTHLISMNYYTLRATLNFKEDSNIRHVEPALAYLLELKRITDHHDINLKYTDPEGQVHIYLAKEKANPSVQKMFVRLLIRPNQAMRDHRTMLEFFPVARAILEQMFETFESVLAKEPWIPRVKDQFICSNHLFINIIAIFFHSADEVAQVLEHLMVYYDERFNRLGIRSAEVLMNLVETHDDGKGLRKSRELVSKSQRVRFFFENSLGLVNATEMHAYRENYCEDGKARLDCFYGKPKHNGDDVFASHTTSSDVELRRNRVLKLGSTYIYDFPKIFTHVLSEIWQESSGMEQEESLISFSEFKLNFEKDGIYINENTCSNEGTSDRIGMVAWIVRYSSPQYPNGREFVLIGNDLDFETGTFGLAEDKLFFYASEYARSKGIPRIYIAANSGAKFGLASGVIDLINAAWIDANDHSKGFEYLFFEQSDRDKIDSNVVITEQITRSNGQIVHKIIAVIGSETEGLGVENLQGSGLIAGATARAYEETFTLTYVTGRAVGIGAYLVRLGQRTIQRADAPIILTGCNALNSILGRDVYLSNLQIGGPQIMTANGISHRTVTNDSDGVREILHWLSYVPVRDGSAIDLIIPPEQLKDPISRKVGVNVENIQANPRAILTGANGNTGLLDADSWTEYLESWAKSVIIGRGKLGGIPVGVICTESRSVESNVPSDPGKMDGVRPAPIRQAGQVWYPDSAWKTAQSLRDFRLEGLPILILANWRGFSGGPGDLYDGILQFGSMIVEELSRATTPVFVYLPIGSELRGGSWVVLDSTINQNGKIEMYADPSARGGVMEPDGIVSIKFRNKEISRLMNRLEGKDLSKTDPSLEESLSCVYRQIAVKFADLHDSTIRMCAKGVIRHTVELAESRHFFYNRLCRRLMEDSFASKLDNFNEAIVLFSELLNQKMPGSISYSLVDDASIVNFLKENENEIKQKIMDKYTKKRIAELQNELKSLMH